MPAFSSCFMKFCLALNSYIKEEHMLKFEVGDIVTLKKKHPCGSFDWEILRVGADFRLKCQGCGHQIMIERKNVEKNSKNLKKALET